MIGLILALVGLACIVYAMGIVAITAVGFLVIVWNVLWAAGRRLFPLFSRRAAPSTELQHSRKGPPRTRRPRATLARGAIAQASGARGRSPQGTNIGHDIKIIAGDQTSGKALYSELDPPPRSKLAEN